VNARWRSAAPLALCACALAVSACGTTKVSKDEVEKQIQAGFAKSGFTAPVKSVKCPDDLDAKVGKSEKCVLTYKSGNALEITATVKSTSGDKARLGFVATKKLK
jgi:hypothetical protein